jgi:hypothetical protein
MDKMKVKVIRNIMKNNFIPSKVSKNSFSRDIEISKVKFTDLSTKK